MRHVVLPPARVKEDAPFSANPLPGTSLSVSGTPLCTHLGLDVDAPGRAGGAEEITVARKDAVKCVSGFWTDDEPCHSPA
jgi:hypothetical protein